MSHELRTPLNSSLILAKLLSDNSSGNLTPEQVTFAQTIYSAGNDLLTLINDILDISKVEAGKLELNPEAVPFDELLSSMKMLFARRRSKRNWPSTSAWRRTRPHRCQRPPAPGADPEEPAVERHQVHRCGARWPCTSIRMKPATCASVQDSGIGIADDQQSLRRLPPGRWHDQPPLRRHGPGPVDFARPGRLAGRQHRMVQHARHGSTFTLVLPPAMPERAAPADVPVPPAPRRPRALPLCRPGRAETGARRQARALPTFQMTATARRRARAASVPCW
jgi:hypothetical protein